jgi:hypothetical protein
VHYFVITNQIGLRFRDPLTFIHQYCPLSISMKFDICRDISGTEKGDVINPVLSVPDIIQNYNVILSFDYALGLSSAHLVQEITDDGSLVKKISTEDERSSSSGNTGRKPRHSKPTKGKEETSMEITTFQKKSSSHSSSSSSSSFSDIVSLISFNKLYRLDDLSQLPQIIKQHI